MTALDALRRRRSWSKVTEAAPTDDELGPLIEAVGRVADHSSLRPWRLITLRGDDRVRLGDAINASQGEPGSSTKPLRASLLIAVVASLRPSEKVPDWEQEAVAAGVAHLLSLLLDEAGWGVIWRSGHHTRSAAVAAAHGLDGNERLMGWLYVGGKPDDRERFRAGVDPATVLSSMPDGNEATSSPVPQKRRKPKHEKQRRDTPSERAYQAEKARYKAAKYALKAEYAARRAAELSAGESDGAQR